MVLKGVFRNNPLSRPFAGRTSGAWAPAVLLLLLAGPLAAVGAMAQTHRIPGVEVVVTAARTPTSFKDTNRSVVIITRKQIESAPVDSVQGLLAYVGGVDVRQRGPLGVQSDLSIRGATFNETLVLVDGVPVNDPQTGHHNMDLPLTLDDIDHIEILRGAASSLYGPGAFGGVVNIITRKGRREETLLRGTAGEHDLRGYSAYAGVPLGASGNRFSFSRATSGGYRTGTDFDVKTAAWGSYIPNGLGHLDLSAGYLDKAFGANGFYTSIFPQAWEHTRTTLLTAGQQVRRGRFTLTPKLYWRRHTDEFLLDRNDPGFYRNLHTTREDGLQLQGTLDLKKNVLIVGGDWGRESIASNRLGDHSRTRGGLFVEDRVALTSRLNVVLGAYGYHYSDWGWRLWPGLDVGYELAPGVRPYLSVTKSFRVPTYTELYYEDPVSRGNPALQPEQAWSVETGVRWQREAFQGSASVFHREGRDLIDWVRLTPVDPWHARNIASVNANGIEADVTWRPGEARPGSALTRVSLSVTHLDQTHSPTPYQSEYVLDYLRDQVSLDLEQAWTSTLSQNWRARHESRVGYKAYTLVDTRLSWRRGPLALYLQVTNLFNTRYREAGYVPMPGRWVSAGIRLGWGPGIHSETVRR